MGGSVGIQQDMRIAKIQRFALLLGFAACPMTQAADAADAEFCQRIAAFADAAPGKAHEITILTDWGEEQTIACRRDESAAAKTLCEWLPLHLSIEFMEGNVSRVLECFSRHSRRAAERVAGKVRVNDPRGVKTRVWIELAYSTTGKDGALPFLTIRAGPRD